MEKPALRVDRERRRLFVVERAQPDEIAPGALEPHVRADHLDDVRAGADLFELVVGETGHQFADTSRSRSGWLVMIASTPAAIRRRIVGTSSTVHT